MVIAKLRMANELKTSTNIVNQQTYDETRILLKSQL